MLPSEFTEYGAFAMCMPCVQIPGVFGSSLVSQSEVKRLWFARKWCWQNVTEDPQPFDNTGCQVTTSSMPPPLPRKAVNALLKIADVTGSIFWSAGG
jgi:hypothetical protein